MNWKKYENQILEIFEEEFPNSQIKADVKIRGRYSKVLRQCDVLIEDYVAGHRMRILIDGKLFNKKVNVKHVEAFIGMLDDVNAQKGLIITNKGYSRAAINLAYYGPAEVELDILSFEDLQQFQAFGAIPYAGSNGVVMPAPFGWLVDGSKSPGWTAILYQRGLTLDQALQRLEFIYVGFWDRKKNNESLDDLITLQNKNLKMIDPQTIIEYHPTILRDDARTKMRSAQSLKYPVPEYTGFVEFDDFILFCVLRSPIELHKKNLRKLEYIMTKVLPIEVKQ